MNKTMLKKALDIIANMTSEEMEKRWIRLLPKHDTKESITDRISMLSDEIDANEEENRSMQEEINKLYDKLDSFTIDDILSNE